MHDLVNDVARQWHIRRDSLDHLANLAAAQAVESKLQMMRPHRPRRNKFRARGYEHE